MRETPHCLETQHEDRYKFVKSNILFVESNLLFCIETILIANLRLAVTYGRQVGKVLMTWNVKGGLFFT